LDIVFLTRLILSILCYSKETNALSFLKTGSKVQLTNLLEEKLINDTLRRKIEVTSIQILDEQSVTTADKKMAF
jgi:hypothetical protein